MKIQKIAYNYNFYKTDNIITSKNITPLKTENDNIKGQISNIYYYPASFGSKKRISRTDKKGLAEKSRDFRVARYSGITCPACGKKMINRSFMKHVYQDLTNIPSDEYLEYLGQYKEYMRPVEESVYNEIYALSQKPGASKDIRNLLVSLRDTKLPAVQNAQMRQIKKMRSLARTLPDDEKEVLLSKLDNLQSVVRKNKPSYPVRRKIIIDRMSKIKIRNPKKYEKLQSYVKAFPTSKDMNSAWIVKYSGKNKYNQDWSSFEIATRFLTSSLANTDHIIAYDIDNNHDDISNYMAMHSSCNAEKSNKPFMQWLNEDKEARIKYMKEYFRDVDELISSKRLKKKKYKYYVAYATETISEVTKGQILPKELIPQNKTESLMQ